MTGLSDIPAYLANELLLCSLAGMGLCVGVLTGLFGVGGAFVIVPMLNVMLGIPYTLATGSSMSFTIGTSAAALGRHIGMGNVATKTMLILAGAAVCGTVLGAHAHMGLKSMMSVRHFTITMHAMFIVTLLATAWLVFAWRPHEAGGLSLLQRLPIGPRIAIRKAGLEGVSLPGLSAVGLAIGVLKGLLGIGGGVLFMPLMLLVVGLTVHQSVGTSLGVVLLSSLAGAVLYGGGGNANLWIIMPLLMGSSVGVQIGAWLCQRLRAQRISRCFAMFVLAVALVVAFDLLRKTGES